MLKRNKKLISKILVLSMCVSMEATTQVSAAANETGGNKTVEVWNNKSVNAVIKNSGFQFDTATGMIIKYVGSDSDVIIPSTIDGVSVTSIGNSAFKNCTSLTSVKIPDTVISIGLGAFESCTSLTSITIPEGVATIENNSFAGCSNLKRGEPT